eukprot:5872229-Pyramimonas_sp.AAC.2
MQPQPIQKPPVSAEKPGAVGSGWVWGARLLSVTGSWKSRNPSRCPAFFLPERDTRVTRFYIDKPPACRSLDDNVGEAAVQ